MLMNKPKETWYFKTSVLVVAFLCVGPFALPLAWFNPRLRLKAKIIISVVVIALSYLLGVLLSSSLKSISSYYKTIF
jgi:hypothetical protein